MTDKAPTITVETAVAAPADTVYGLITDLDTMAQFGEEVTAMKWAKGNAGTVGSVFRGSNRNGWHRWTTTCTVSEAEAGRAFAWNVSRLGQPIARWRYEVTPPPTVAPSSRVMGPPFVAAQVHGPPADRDPRPGGCQRGAHARHPGAPQGPRRAERLSLLTGLFVDEVDADADGLRPTSGEHVAEQSSAGCEVRLPWPAHGQCAHHAVLARQQ